jgi:hypothetical protein
MFDLNHHFVAAYAQHYVSSRLESGRRFRYGRPGPGAAMIAACAAALRRLATALDSLATGSADDLPDPAARERRSAH